jgi:hypothetical protein
MDSQPFTSSGAEFIVSSYISDHGQGDRTSLSQNSTSCDQEQGDRINRSLPKNFLKPSTSFFWHQAGRCKKRDVDCPYAHYNTGYVANSPFHVTGRMYFFPPQFSTLLTITATGSFVVAGKNAQKLHATTAAKEHQGSIANLRDWKRQLAAREDILNRREALITATEQEVEIAMRQGESSTQCRERRGARHERAGRRTRNAPMQQWRAI